MMNNMGLGFVFTARDLASSKMMSLERRFMSLDRTVGLGTDRITSAFAALGVGLAVFTAGAALVGGALSLANAAGQFEQGLAAVGAVTRATTQELGMLREAAINAGIETQFSPEEAVAGLQSLATAGQTATQATKTLIPVLDLAAGSLGQLGVAQSAEAVVGTLNAYGFAAEQASGVTDKLLRITQLTNFQTRDFEAGLSKAAATGAVFGQNLDDVLITMGLLRNRNIDASSSATAFRESVRRVGAETRAQNAITGAGVKVFDDQTKKMRSIVDIMSDFASATTGMTDEERNRRVVTAFGARGLLAFNSVLNASYTTMRDGAQVTLRGAEAIEALRTEMAGAEGTAARFREQLLDTFEGQKTLLRGTLQTFAVVLGEPFAAVFKPIVRAVVEMLNMLLRAFQVIPAPIKRVFAGAVLVVGSILSLIGAVIAAKAGFVLLVLGLKAAGITIGGLAAVLAPAIVLVGALALAVAGLYVAFQRNVGGIGDMAERLRQRVTLAFDGIKQLFEQGGFSGAVRDELNKAENAGLKDFLINLFLWGNRLKNFFSGIGTGFSAGVEAARPSIDAFLGALERLGTALGFLGERDDAATASAKFKAFGSAGESVGRTLAQVFDLIVQAMTAVVNVTTGIASAWSEVKPAADMLSDAVAQLGTNLSQSIGSLNGNAAATRESGNAWSSLGTLIAYVVAGIVATIAVFVSIISAAVSIVTGVIGAVMSIFSGLADVVTGVVFIIGGIINGSWTDIWTGMKLVAFGVIDAIVGAVLSLAGAIAGVVDAIAGLFGESTKLQSAVSGFKDFTHREMAKDFGVESLSFTPVRPTTASTPRTSSPPTSATMPAVAALPASASPAIVAAAAPRTPPPAPVVVNVQIDGQTVARAVHKAGADNAARSFSPVPTY